MQRSGRLARTTVLQYTRSGVGATSAAVSLQSARTRRCVSPDRTRAMQLSMERESSCVIGHQRMVGKLLLRAVVQRQTIRSRRSRSTRVTRKRLSSCRHELTSSRFSLLPAGPIRTPGTRSSGDSSAMRNGSTLLGKPAMPTSAGELDGLMTGSLLARFQQSPGKPMLIFTLILSLSVIRARASCACAQESRKSVSKRLGNAPCPRRLSRHSGSPGACSHQAGKSVTHLRDTSYLNELLGLVFRRSRRRRRCHGAKTKASGLLDIHKA